MFAYLVDYTGSASAPDELVVVRDGHVVARQTGLFSSSNNLNNGAVWTCDGRFVSVLDYATNPHGGSRPVAVLSIDAQTGSVRHTPCNGCTTMAAVGAGRIMLSLSQNSPLMENATTSQFVIIDPTTAAPPTVLVSKLPTFTLSTRLIGNIGTQALVAGANSADVSAYGGPEQLYLLSVDGTSRHLTDTDSNIQVSSVAIENHADGSSQIAIAGTWHESACLDDSTVVQLNPVDGRKVEIRSPQAAAGFVREITDLWWGSDNELYGTWTIYQCGGEFPTIVTPSSLWRARNGQWVHVSSEQILMERDLGATSRLLIVRSDEAAPDGTLYLDIGGKRTRMADQVAFIVVP